MIHNFKIADIEYDAETGIYTTFVDKFSNVYGEGKTTSEAIDNWITAALERVEIYSSNTEKYSKFFDDNSKKYLELILECKGDRGKLKKVFF